MKSTNFRVPVFSIAEAVKGSSADIYVLIMYISAALLLVFAAVCTFRLFRNKNVTLSMFLFFLATVSYTLAYYYVYYLLPTGTTAV